MDSTHKVLAFVGLEAFKHAVLLVLYGERTIRGRSLLRIQISERIGIPKPGEYYSSNADLIGGILWHLEEDGYVENTGSNRWRITEEGVSVIEGS